MLPEWLAAVIIWEHAGRGAVDAWTSLAVCHCVDVAVSVTVGTATAQNYRLERARQVDFAERAPGKPTALPCLTMHPHR